MADHSNKLPGFVFRDPDDKGDVKMLADIEGHGWLLDPNQLKAISRLLAERSGPSADAVNGTKSFPPATPEGTHNRRK